MADFEWRSQIDALRRDVAASLAFLTRIPAARLRVDPGSAPDFRIAARAFPLAGAVVGAVGGVVVLLAAALHLPPLASALLAIGAILCLTGALHEDGLADCADGFGGGTSRSAKLEIMRDSRIGTYGALALVVSIGLRAALLAAFLPVSPWGAAFALVAMEAVGRTALVHVWATLPPARFDGLSASTGRPTRDTLFASVAIVLVVALVAGTIAAGPIAAIVALAAAALATYGFEALCRRQIGGQTGDTLGAAEQLGALAYLLALVAFA